MRDLAFHDDDLIVATHGRGFWVLDNMSALRQLTSPLTRTDAILFKPSEAVEVIAGSDDGTPQPRDEALAENPPTGAIIYYYLKSNQSGPVTIEIIDPSGETIRKY